MSKRKKETKLNFAEMGQLTHNPFGALANSFGMQSTSEPETQAKPDSQPTPEQTSKTSQKNSLLVRAKRTINQKWVTQIYQFEGDSKELLQRLKKKLGTGGSVQSDHLEIQGDKRKEVEALLVTMGFKVRQG
ncbi:MAG: translation initiation factor [Acidobacteria bacterium]|nr:translation initiation factor [Acidobacteriota bacterium]